MSSGLAISAFMPSVISSGIFSTRRANSGAEALSASNPFVGAMNMDIAGGQILNAAKGVSTIAKESKSGIASGIASAEESIKALSKGDKFLNGVGKVLNFTADNINPIICATGAVKVLTADDKEDALIHEGAGLGVMFAAENTHKLLFGNTKMKTFNPAKMEIAKDGLYEISNGAKKLIAKEGSYKMLNSNRVAIENKGLLENNPFYKKQVDALKDYCATKKICNKSLNFVPGAIKGLSFAAASIFGYKLGMAIADKLSSKENAAA